MFSCRYTAWSPTHVLRHRDLLEGLGLHEVEAHVVLVEVVVGLLLEVGALDLVGGAVALGDLHAVGDAAHVEMRHRRALAGMDVLGLHDDAQLAVDVEHVAFAHRACDNLDHAILRRKRLSAARGAGGGRPAKSIGRFLQAFPRIAKEHHGPCPSAVRSARPGGTATPMPTGGRSCSLRGACWRRCARWFEAEGFVEVETSALQVSPGNETHLHAFATELIGPDGARRPLYLHTSPEFACKKLLAAGEERIFTFAPVFRNRERGALHHPAFTMLEWYRADEPYERLMEDCAAMLRVAAEARRAARCVSGDAPPIRSRARAHHRRRGLPALRRNRPARHALPAAARRARVCRSSAGAGIRVADDDTWGDIFSRVLVERYRAPARQWRATLLTEYPAHPALARAPPRDPRVAERFELYACGVELANASAS